MMKKLISLLIVIVLAAAFAVSASAETVLKGDVDMNGKVTAADARTVLRAAARLAEISETQAIIADVNGDSKVTASDARTILRCAANIEKDLGTVEIGGETTDPTTEPVATTETTTQPPVEMVEVSGGINMNYKDFIAEYGEMRKVGTSDGTIEYSNGKLTIISDPTMVEKGNISSIIIKGGDYTLVGISAGMSKADAVKALKDAKWMVKEETATSVYLTKNSMYLTLTVAAGNVTVVEYGFAVALVTPTETTTEEPTTEEPTTEEPTTEEPTTEEPTTEEPTTEEPTTEEPTTEEPTTEEPTTEEPTTEEPTTEEPTTEEPTTEEPTTEEPTTEEPTTEEPTTEEPTTSEVPDGEITYDQLPDQVKTFLGGTFGIIGYNYSEGKRNAISMYVSPDAVKAGMSVESTSGKVSLDILITGISGKSKTYLILPNDKKYCEFSETAMNMLGINPDDLKVDFGSSSSTYESIIKSKEKSVGVEYVVYTVNTGKEYCKIFTIDGEIKRIETYNGADNVLKSRIDVETFISVLPADTFSVSGYKKTTFLLLFGGLL